MSMGFGGEFVENALFRGEVVVGYDPKLPSTVAPVQKH